MTIDEEDPSIRTSHVGSRRSAGIWKTFDLHWHYDKSKEEKKKEAAVNEVSANLLKALAAFTLRPHNVKYFSWKTAANPDVVASSIVPETASAQASSEIGTVSGISRKHLTGLLEMCKIATTGERQHLAVLLFNICQNPEVRECIGQVGYDDRVGVHGDDGYRDDGLTWLVDLFGQLEREENERCENETRKQMDDYYMKIKLLDVSIEVALNGSNPKDMIRKRSYMQQLYTVTLVLDEAIGYLSQDEYCKKRLRNMCHHLKDTNEQLCNNLKRIVYPNVYTHLKVLTRPQLHTQALYA
jgi:hypothetical protein